MESVKNVKPNILKHEKSNVCLVEKKKMEVLHDINVDMQVNENGEKTNNIIGDICPDFDHFLSFYGKFNNTQKIASNCDKFGFIKNVDNSEELVSLLCDAEYYLKSEGECINCLNAIFMEIPLRSKKRPFF